jgi:hypothetical protein
MGIFSWFFKPRFKKYSVTVKGRTYKFTGKFVRKYPDNAHTPDFDYTKWYEMPDGQYIGVHYWTQMADDIYGPTDAPQLWQPDWDIPKVIDLDES